MTIVITKRTTKEEFGTHRDEVVPGKGGGMRR